ncbi:MAG: hypothetical protein ACXVFN_07620 [Solirubrobacteraceae bacterium]
MDDRADALYGLPLERFVPERDALAKALRAAGDREAAAAVKALAKPTRAAWAVNVAVREHPEAARALAEAARLLAEAQQELLAGGDAAALREATGRAREAIDALAAQAPDAGPAADDKVRATLRAATVDAGVLADVTAGRVAREQAASGFGALPATVPARRPPARQAPERPDRAELRRRERLRRAKEAEAAAEQDVDTARQSIEQVEATLAGRRAELRAAEARLKDARRRRERAEG